MLWLYMDKVACPDWQTYHRKTSAWAYNVKVLAANTFSGNTHYEYIFRKYGSPHYVSIQPI